MEAPHSAEHRYTSASAPATPQPAAMSQSPVPPVRLAPSAPSLVPVRSRSAPPISASLVTSPQPASASLSAAPLPTPRTPNRLSDEEEVEVGPLSAVGDEGLAKEEDLQRVDEDIIASIKASITGLPVTNEAWTGSEEDSGSDSDDIGDVKESAICPSSLDIMSWCQKVVNSEPESASLIPTPFERGVMGGMSVNDVSMIQGLVHPLVYIQLIDLSKDLSSLSRC